MKERKIWKNVIKWTLIFAAINQLIIPIQIPRFLITYKPTIKTDAKKVRNYKTIPKPFKTIDYLNLANMLTHNFQEGTGDCKDYAIETFNVYKQLVKQNNRKELEDNIKLIVSYPRLLIKGKDGHVYLKFKDEEEWKPYEALNVSTPILKVEEIKKYSKESLEKRMDIAGSTGREDLSVIARSLNGTRLSYPLPASVFNDGAIGLIYFNIFHSKK
ncbi:MAG: hypothetical protein ISS23_01040 [Nanoarchaeota archaeon]|nr:hypothetical protein [Nanoarchaeota archaeon]